MHLLGVAGRLVAAVRSTASKTAERFNEIGPAGSSLPGFFVSWCHCGIRTAVEDEDHQETFRGRPGRRGFRK
jgi:hypothetical protein